MTQFYGKYTQMHCTSVSEESHAFLTHSASYKKYRVKVVGVKQKLRRHA